MAEEFATKLTKKVEQGSQFDEDDQTGEAIKCFEEVIKEQVPKGEDLSEAMIKAKEQATYKLANIYKNKGLVDELIDLQKAILPLFIDFPKSKTAKIMRSLFDLTI